ncbi:aldose epimerase family protein [Bacteroides heparinolyticus]|uniref:aldose epimerase family protein n=1 Tax=Prevotella heparinolytica TaxID=28113 RepID=UPI00359FB842
MRNFIALFWVAGLFLSVACRQADLYKPAIYEEKTTVRFEDKAVRLFRLVNKNGMCVKVTNYAASLTDVVVPDRQGNFEHVVLGFDSVEHYLGKHPKFGATVGRFANRIRNAEFKLQGQVYHLEKNNRGYSIHGGTKGFYRQVFETDTFYTVKDTAIVVFKYRSVHLEGGFPGNLELSIAYKLTNRNEIVLEYTATTDKPTVINLTNHSYFNLAGCKEAVSNHIYMIKADTITQVDSMGIPTGELVAVAGTAYDYTSPKPAKIRMEEEGKGYDVNYKLSKLPGVLELAAVVVEPISGRVLKAYTTEPGMQFYIPDSNMDYLAGHGGRIYGKYYGFCLEMQHFPDSPNIPHFPTTSLLPGEVYRQVTVYKFETTSE